MERESVKLQLVLQFLLVLLDQPLTISTISAATAGKRIAYKISQIKYLQE